MIFEITFIIASLFQTYIYYLFSVCFYREKAEPKRVFGGCSIFFAVTTIAYLIFNVPVFEFYICRHLCFYHDLYLIWRKDIKSCISYGIDHRNDGSFRSTCCYLYWSGWSKSGTAKSVL